MTDKFRTLGFMLFAIFALVLVSGVGSAEVLAKWALTSDGTPNSVNANINAGTFSGGPSLSQLNFGSDGAYASNWSLGNLDNSKYFQITLSPKSGSSLTINKINFGERRSPTGIRNYSVQWSLNSDFSSSTVIATVAVPDDDNERDGSIAALNIQVADGKTIYIRWFGYNAKDTQGTWRINDNTLSVEGTITSPQASLSLQSVQDLKIDKDGVVNVTNNGKLDITSIQLTGTGDFPVTFSPSSLNSLIVGESKLVNATGNFANIKFGDNFVSITAKGKAGSVDVTSNSVPFAIQKTFCRVGDKGLNLSITRVRIENNGEGTNEKWKLLDDVEVTVRVKNEGKEDIDDVIVELGLFDSQGTNRVGDIDFDSKDEEEVNIGKLNDGNDETVTFSFKVPADIDEGSYKLAIKVYSDDLGEEKECTSTSSELSDKIFEKIEIENEDDEGKFIAFVKPVLAPSEATCGEGVKLTIDVYNIGNEDQDQVKVSLFNKELNLVQSLEIRKDLNIGDKQTISFDFTLPKNLENKVYQLELSAEYDYRNGVYRESSDESTKVPLKVIGCSKQEVSPTEEKIAVINAALESGAKAGENLAVKVTVTNLKDKKAEFIIGAKDYESWSDLIDVSERIFELEPGKSKEVTFKFAVSKEATGENSFVVEILSEGKTQSREVAVNIEQPSTITGGFKGLGSLGDNAFLWIIGVINVILIIVIIVVAVRISRK